MAHATAPSWVRLLLGALAVALVIGNGSVAAQDEGRLPAFPLDLVAPGLTGYGLTMGPGDRLERFEVRVVALQSGMGPAGSPLVLVETRGAFIDAAGGVAAGMSGSPVYLDHAGERTLLGAIGYVFPDTDGRLALVTPIEAMRTQTETLASPPPGATPVATPLLVTGLGTRALAMLERSLDEVASHPLTLVQAGGTGSSTGPSPALEPGSAIAIALVRGDVDVAAIGTVTEVVGDDVLALGHPFLGVGPSGWILSPASITAVVPNRRVPFKLGTVGSEVLGAVLADRPAGIGARLGVEPPLLPVTLTIDAGGERTVLRFEVVTSEPLWPVLVAVATLEGLDRAWQRRSPGSARLAWELELAGGPPLRILEEVSHEGDVALETARMAGAPLALLALNPFETPQPTGLQLLIEVDDQRRDGEIVEALLEAGPVRAGGTLGVFLRLQPWRRQSEVHALTVTLPSELAEGAELVVRGAGEPRDDEHEGGVDTLILSYAELLTVLRERPRSGDLVIEVQDADGRWQVLERRSFPYLVRGVERVPLAFTEDTTDDDE
ncbi:MAG: hypothetical protein EA416_17565 [Trueperaceae bacterium]|nr:MAG: hypothetical protein EA416_17565 [Trueperaceae bacterium]